MDRSNRTKFVSVGLTEEARNALRAVSLRLSLDLNRRVSMADAVTVLHTVAQQHPEEITETARRLLNPEEGSTS